MFNCDIMPRAQKYALPDQAKNNGLLANERGHVAARSAGRGSRESVGADWRLHAADKEAADPAGHGDADQRRG